MNYKVICTDIDGTLLNKDRELSEKTILEISRIKNHVPVILVSSRMPKAMRHLQETLGIKNQPLIAYNGGLVLLYNENQEEPTVFLTVPISYDVTRIIYNKVKNTDVHVSLYINDHWYVEQLDAWAAREINNTKVYPTIAGFNSMIDLWESNLEGPHKIMCMGPEAEIHALEMFLRETCSDKLNIYRSKSTYLELASKHVSKAVAIKKLLQEHMGFRLEDVVAFGDNYNDIEMLDTVGLGIAVANANEALKKVADEITLSNLEDGVAVSIKKYFV
ncbi:MAG: HAD family phosphatase [Saprospiraceae bacterium]|nr:HAD family phosphatase [Saprospiraceae bacterium]